MDRAESLPKHQIQCILASDRNLRIANGVASGARMPLAGTRADKR
jgi:hypothetical protein